MIAELKNCRDIKGGVNKLKSTDGFLPEVSLRGIKIALRKSQRSCSWYEWPRTN